MVAVEPERERAQDLVPERDRDAGEPPNRCPSSSVLWTRGARGSVRVSM